ncbi:hypothetical protein ACFV4X_26420 [Streptomyces ardesiacus]|uniref:hypothetical protein n=1 Tax=Streptomyces ardesiacus TaxID=285564 RepID=UPI00365FC771
MKFTRRVSSVLAVLTGLIGANLLISQPAQAATTAISCSGTITASYTVSYPGDGVVGELVVYYNTSSGGTNSACLHHRGKSYGVSSETTVFIDKCSQTSGEGRTCTQISQDYDSGNYAYYAGPVGVTGTANNCVSVHGYIEYRGVNLQVPGAGKTVGC